LSFLRFYDEAVVSYFSNIKIEDGNGLRSPQVMLGTPSRQGVKLNVTNDTTPVLPLISIVRTGMNATSETNLVKSHVTRPHVYSLNSTGKLYEGFETMPYNFVYQVDYFSLVQDMHNSITEQLLFRVHKNHYIKVLIDTTNHHYEVNPYIHSISLSDATTYTQIADNVSRIFHGTLGFSLYGFLINEKFVTPSVLSTTIEIKDNVDQNIVYDTITETLPN